MAYRTVLFDFDGTLMDTGKGITASMAYASKTKGIPLALEQTWRYIGPPFKDFLAEEGVAPEDAADMIRLYRSRYFTEGWKLSTPYPGMFELLDALEAAGIPAYICTSKPETITAKMVEELKINVRGYVGADDAENRHKKEDIIRLCAARYGFALDSSAVMIGDAPRDISGGKLCGVSTIGALYGYGRPEEMLAQHANAYVCSVAELSALLLG